MTRPPVTTPLPTRFDETSDEDPKVDGILSRNIKERLFKARTVLIFGEVNTALAQATVTQLLALSAESNEPIRVLVHSQGGHVEAGDTIFDVIRFIEPEVKMIGTGWVASAGTHIFLGAPKERRYCLPNTRFLIHQPSGGAQGRAGDIAIQAQEIVKMRERLAQVIAEKTGQKIERVREDIERDYWMSTEEAKDYGILGTVINKGDQIKF